MSGLTDFLCHPRQSLAGIHLMKVKDGFPVQAVENESRGGNEGS